MTLPGIVDECVWPVVWGCGTSCEHYEALTPDVQDVVMSSAIDRLRAWTAYGMCPRRIRPCRRDCDASHKGCGCSAHPCSCKRLHEMKLPYPVGAINEIRIDGAVVDEATYRVDNWRWLVNLEGEAWPNCQNLTLPPTEPDTFEIDYMDGFPVPAGGQIAAGVLVCQLSRAVCGGKCDLPVRATSVSRQGMQLQFDLLPGQTGLFLIDDWVTSANKSGTIILTPEKYYRMPREVTWAAA